MHFKGSESLFRCFLWNLSGLPEPRLRLGGARIQVSEPNYHVLVDMVDVQGQLAGSFNFACYLLHFLRSKSLDAGVLGL